MDNHASFNVTDVRVAFECPRLFYLGNRFGGRTMFVPPGRVAGIGNDFHDLSKKFVHTARQESRFRTC